MFNKKMENVFTASRPLFIFLKALGIFLPSFNGPSRNGLLSVKLVDKIWFVTVYFSLCIFLLSNLLKNTHYYSTSSVILMKAWELCATIGLVSTLIVMTYQYIYAREIANTLKMIHEFDEKVSFCIQKSIKLRENLHIK